MNTPRKFDSEITVDEFDRWMFRGNEITQPNILKYFRENLKQDETGIYIDNVFGELSENGYLNIKGFACHIIEITLGQNGLIFYGDDDRIFNISEFEIYQTSDGKLIGIHPERKKLIYRFNWQAATSLAESLEDIDGIVYLINGDEREVLPIYPGETIVSPPSNYD